MEDGSLVDARRILGTALAVRAVALSAVPSEAQIYTRRNAKGVVEATNIPVAKGYRLTYPGKGTIIHSSAYLRFFEIAEHEMFRACGLPFETLRQKGGV